MLACVLAGWAGPAAAQSGGATDAAKLLEQLKALEETVTKARTGNNLAAIDAITEAAAVEAKAVALWIDSVRETEFRDKDKKEAEFRAWRDGAGKRLSEPGAAGALRLHLQYLLITLKVANATTEEEKAAVFTPLLAYLDDLSKADKAVLRNRSALDTSVLSTPIAKRYKLDVTVRPPETWPLIPGDLTGIYEKTILPYLRQRKDVARLQTAWARRIQQEAAQVATQESEFATKNFRENVLPGLEWGQAMDLYLAGSDTSAAKMLAIIQQNQAHKQATNWIKELRMLLTAGKEATAAAAGESSGGAQGGGTAPPEAPDAPGGETTPPEPAADPEPATPATPGQPVPARPRGPAPTFPPNIRR